MISLARKIENTRKRFRKLILGSGFALREAIEIIDELVAAKLKRTKTLPSGLCSDAEFVRRVYLDLTGLPPGIAEIDAFLADSSEDAYEKVVDRLLAKDDRVDLGCSVGFEETDLLRLPILMVCFRRFFLYFYSQTLYYAVDFLYQRKPGSTN